jgi:adenylate cyclase
VAVVPAAAAWGRTLCVDGLIANLESLDAAAAGVGHITCLPDRDGVYRHYNLLIRDGAGFVPSMSLRVACDLLEVPRARIEVRAGRCLRLPEARTSGGARRDLCVPIGNDGTLPVNYAGYWETSFPHYSLHRLLAAAERPRDWEALRGELNGTVAIVSDVSTRTQDFGATPLEHVYPKSGIHANVLNALMTGALLRHTHPAEKAALALLAGLVALLLAARLKAAGFVPAMAGMIVLIYAGAFGAFCWRGVLIDVFEMTLALGLATVAITAAKYFYAERDRIRLRSRFESYLAPAVLERILRSPSLIDQFQQKTITIVFTDIAGFTPWCSTQTPAMIHQTLNQYFEAMTAIVFQYGGTVDKYIGDGLLVFFGDPLEQPDHALRAVRAAIAMQARARKLQADWRDTRGLNLRIRIGINTGEVVVGNMGSASRLDYTVIGAHVNLTQRLESNAPVGGILLSEATYQQVKDRIRAGLHGTIQAKGIPGDLNVYTVDMEAEITSA